MSLSSRSQRGSTIVELMTVVVVLGLMMTMVVSIVAPLMRSQNRLQAKLDTVQAAAAALYRVQRDLRQTYYQSAYACTTGASPACSRPTSFGTTTSAIAFPTAYQNGTGQFQLQVGGSSPGYPNWQGVMVYWLDSTGDLHWAFDALTGSFTVGSQALSATLAAQAVSDATTGVVAGTEIAQNIQQLTIAAPGTANILSFEMQAQSTENGAVNETTYVSNVLTRQ